MRLHHICIQTDRYEESLRFYTDILGFEDGKLFKIIAPEGTIIEIRDQVGIYSID